MRPCKDWATVFSNFGGAGVRRKEVRIDGPGLQEGAKATLLSRDATRGLDPLFFDDLRLEYSSIPETILGSIINNSLQPIHIMKLSTEFLEGRTNKAGDKDLDNADIRGVKYFLLCFTIYCSILFAWP